MNRSAFTLLELLVAVAIIAALAALLLSGIHSVQEKGRATQCISNLRQLVAANLAYAADHEGQYVDAQDRMNRIRWHGTRESGAGKFDPTKGPLAPYLGGDGRVKLCPTLKNVLTGEESFEDGTGGYGYNAVYIGGTPRNRYSAERLSNIPSPARTVMFTDTAFARSNGLQEYAYCEPWEWVDASGRLQGRLFASVHFRHGGAANVAWCDGHVTAEPPSEIDGENPYGGDGKKWKLGWFGPSAENGFWNPKPPDGN